MPMIKCPECGHPVSDKAPVCPMCGVKIAGNIVICEQCNEIYLKEAGRCPKCGHAAPTGTNNTQQQQYSGTTAGGNNVYTSNTNPEPKKKNHLVPVVILVAVLAVCGMAYYMIDSKGNAKEAEAYNYAMTSNEPMVLQSYLDTYKDAPEEHIDSVKAHLDLLQQTDKEWANAVVSGTKTALKEYLQKHPDSPHKIEIIHLMDSIDWAEAASKNTQEALQRYIDTHEDGEHVDDAHEAMDNLQAKTVSTDEKTIVASAFGRFFHSISERNESALASSVTPILDSFLGKSGATQNDVITFLNKIYKDDVEKIDWNMGNDCKIEKMSVGDKEYMYNATFMSVQEIKHTDGNITQKQFRISATVTQDGKISTFNMNIINK